MARGVNRVIILGNLGQDPESRFMPSGGAVTNISIATSETWKDKQTGQAQERTEWTKVVFFARLAEIAAQYLRKGSKIYIEGSLRTRKWTDQQGVERYSTEVVASEMQMLDSRQSDGGQQQVQRQPQQSGGFGGGGPGHQGQHYGRGGNQNSPQQSQTAHNQSHGGGFDDFDENLPF